MNIDRSFFSHRSVEPVPAGTVLLRSSKIADSVIYVQSGSVVLGILGDGGGPEAIVHQLGTVEGPSWLEASAAVLQEPGTVDALAQTPVQVYRLSLAEFGEYVRACPPGMQSLLRDVARAHRQQAELAVSRLAKDAEARCAEWLLSHAQTNDQGTHLVQLQQRKRAIATQLGIAPETLSRVLRHMREQRLIGGSGRTVDLVDPAGLRRLASPRAARSLAVT